MAVENRPEWSNRALGAWGPEIRGPEISTEGDLPARRLAYKDQYADYTHPPKRAKMRLIWLRVIKKILVIPRITTRGKTMDSLTLV